MAYCLFNLTDKLWLIILFPISKEIRLEKREKKGLRLLGKGREWNHLSLVAVMGACVYKCTCMFSSLGVVLLLNVALLSLRLFVF